MLIQKTFSDCEKELPVWSSIHDFCFRDSGEMGGDVAGIKRKVCPETAYFSFLSAFCVCVQGSKRQERGENVGVITFVSVASLLLCVCACHCACREAEVA